MSHDTHVIREGHDPKRGRYWGFIGDDAGNYGWVDRFRGAETFTEEQAAELAPELEEPCVVVAIADIEDEDVAP